MIENLPFGRVYFWHQLLICAQTPESIPHVFSSLFCSLRIPRFDLVLGLKIAEDVPF